MKKIRRQLIDQLDDHWYIDQSIGHGAGHLRQPAPASTARPSEIVTLQKHAAASFVPRTGRLLVERRVGRGRVVVSAFTLSSRQFVNRKRFDEFFHACVLRRPQRFFALTENQEISVGWADRNRDKYDARRVSSLRFFSRDALPSELASETEGNGTSTTDSQDYLFDTIGYQSDPQSGVAGWSDFSGVATSARDALQKAAGITVPSASIVCQMLGVYLLFLVPLNWGFFRLIGRVEWAWVAAPVIAVAGAVAVVRLAQLDIGFVRSRTEIAIVETQGEYGRAHVTRYTGMYSSLSTEYNLRFREDSALCQPFSLNPSAGRLRLQTPETVTLRRDNEVHLSGYRVLSNSTGMVHSEQIYRLEGPIYLASTQEGNYRVINDSEFNLRGVIVVHRTSNGVEFAVVDQLGSKASTLLDFSHADFSAVRQLWDDSPTTAAVTPEGEVGLRTLLATALNPRRLRREDIRLVGWTDQEVPGLQIGPPSSQQTFRTLVLAHLRYGPLPEPRGDWPRWARACTPR